MENRNNDFLNGAILSPLLRFAGPVLLALFLQAMYGAVDLIVVGKFAARRTDDGRDRPAGPEDRRRKTR